MGRAASLGDNRLSLTDTPCWPGRRALTT